MATDIEIAWAAGLFEGIGTIRYYRDMLSLKLGTKDLDIAVRFREIAAFGSITAKRLDYFEWNLARQKDCRELMILFWPYLSDARKTRWNHILELRELAFYPRICPSCQKEYKPKRKAQVCCSSKCASNYAKKGSQ